MWLCCLNCFFEIILMFYLFEVSVDCVLFIVLFVLRGLCVCGFALCLFFFKITITSFKAACVAVFSGV